MNKSYATNFALETGNDNFIFKTAHSLNHRFAANHEDIVEKCHIYCVVDCPRITFIPDSLEYEIVNNELSYTVVLEYRYEGETKRVRVVDHMLVPDYVSYVEIDEYPHSDIIIMDANDNVVSSATAGMLAYAFGIEDITSMKVLYVGKSTGLKTKRNANDRIQSHSTIQQINAVHNARHPDRSLYIGLFNFSPVRLYSLMDGMDHTKIFGEEDFHRFIRIQQFKLSLEQKTAIIEAALIRYFEPEYNEKLKKDLPAKNSKILAECYKYDFSAIAVNFYTEDENNTELKFYLYSDKISKSAKHNIRIELVDPEVRKGFFSVGGESWAPKGTIRRNNRR